MVDRNELQNKARLVESHRQHLDELERRMEQIVNVINEHQITEEILSRLVTLSSKEQAKAHVSIGAGVTLHYHHQTDSEGTATVDLGSGVFGERKWSEVIEILANRRSEFNELHATLLKQAGAIESKLGVLAQEFKQAGAIESKLGVLAQEFNQAAEQLQNIAAESNSPELPSDKSDTSDKKPSKTKQRRRSGMFSSELTLDD